MYDYSDLHDSQMVPISVEDDVIKNHLKNLRNFEKFSTQKSMSRLIYSLVNSEANTDAVRCRNPFEHPHGCCCALREVIGGQERSK